MQWTQWRIAYKSACGAHVCSVIRDTKEYGRDLDQSLYQYVNYVKPAFEEFCLPVIGNSIAPWDYDRYSQ